MNFGVYFHIPYCLQRCKYCDFATYVHDQILPAENYVRLLLTEIEHSDFFTPRTLNSIYFGGGTPSLIPPPLILTLIHGLEKKGFKRGPACEVTIEINPATVSKEALTQYLNYGINRFSVGAQTFNDSHLKYLGREHNSDQTLQTLSLLQENKVNFSFDLLFALPNQSIEDLAFDLKWAVRMGAKHISPYCLTVPQSHPLSINRPDDDTQIKMFEMIEQSLVKIGMNKYEISNFSFPGFESKHNLLYWDDASYWGIGLSAHSYSNHLESPSFAPWGIRFWNANTIELYEKYIQGLKPGSSFDLFPPTQYENLKINQSLTDFCHTSLRKKSGLSLSLLKKKFPEAILNHVFKRLERLSNKNLIAFKNNSWSLTDEGTWISNQIFEELTFLDFFQ